jgi:hypothetical protein
MKRNSANLELTKEQRFIEQLHRDNDRTRRQINKGMKECAPGTANYLAAVKALNELNSKERDELIRLGLVPSDLSIATTTCYHYVSHVPGVFDSRDAAHTAVAKRDAKVADGVATSDEDERVRQGLEAEYGTSTTSNTATSSTQEPGEHHE